MLFCHSTPLGDGQDDIKDLKIVLDPTKTWEAVSILALGVSAKNQSWIMVHDNDPNFVDKVQCLKLNELLDTLYMKRNLVFWC